MAWWLTQHLVTVAVLTAIVHLTTRLLRAGPGVRHLLWTIVLIKLVLPPFLEWPWRIQTASASSHAMQTPAAIAVATHAPGSNADRPATAAAPSAATAEFAASLAVRSEVPPDWHAVAGLIWLAGTCVFGILHGARSWRMRRLVRHARNADDDLSHRAETVAAQMAMTPAQVRLAPIPSPFVWGGLRPVILWPEALPQSVGWQAVDGLLAHELAHVKRRDHWIGWLELAAGCAWWWNPLFWHVRHHLRADAELACDAWVAAIVPHARRHYAEALLTFSAGSPAVTAPITALGVRSDTRRLMERRLAMIMRAHAPVRLSRLALCTGAFVAALAFPAWAQRPVATTTPSPQPAPRPAPATATAGQPAPAESPTIVQFTPARARTTGGRQVAVAPVMVQTGDGGRTFETAVPVTAQYFASNDGDLPAEAQALVRKFSENTAQTRRQAEEAITRERTALVTALEKMQDAETKAGHLDEAVAIRNRIRALQPRVTLQYSTAGRMLVSPDEPAFPDGFVVAPPPPPPAPPPPGRPADPPAPPAPPRR